jgi:plasmid stability protein
MRLRKLGTIVQVGLRLREDLRRKLAAAAEEHHRSFNEELTKRLEESLEKETVQTLENAAQSLAQDALRLRSLTSTVVERMGTWPGLLASQPQKKEGGKT